MSFSGSPTSYDRFKCKRAATRVAYRLWRHRRRPCGLGSVGMREQGAEEKKRESASEWMVASINETAILKRDPWRIVFDSQLAGHERYQCYARRLANTIIGGLREGRKGVSGSDVTVKRKQQ